MTSSTFIKLRINAAEQFKEMVSEPTPNTKLYITYGRVTPWSNEAVPDSSNTSVATEYEVWHNMIGGKKVTANDLRHVIPRFNWTSNTIYTAYDHMNPNLYDGNTAFYVLTSAYNVYKCIANNSGAVSTVEPTAIQTTVTSTTSDHYVWKYMYTLSDQDLLRFTTDNFMPVKTLSSDDGSTQWAVQSAAISGSIESVFIINAGTDITNNSNVAVVISGDGTSATANAFLNITANTSGGSNTLSYVTVLNSGYNYTYASAAISGGGGYGAILKPIISPAGGHGADPLYELGGSTIMISPQIVRDQDSVLPTTNDFRQIALISDPRLLSGDVASNTAFFQGYTIATTGSGDYVADEYVYQGTSLGAASFFGKVLFWDSSNSTLKIVNAEGTPSTGTITGANSAASRFVTSSVAGNFDKYSGRMLYVNNITPITRSSDQTETFQILIRF